MDETETKNSNDPIILKQELDINLNDLFTIDFKNLKIFLTTILKNQNEMSQKMNTIETSIDDKENKNNKNFLILDKKIKAIEQNFSLNSEKLNDLKKEFDNRDNQEKEEIEIPPPPKKKENVEFIISNLNMEIVASNYNKTDDKDKTKDILPKEEEKKEEKKEEVKEEIKEDKKEKEEDKKEEIKEEIIINEIKKTPTIKKPNLSEKDKKVQEKEITEEEPVKIEEEKKIPEKEIKPIIKEVPQKIIERRYENPYRNIPIRTYNNEMIDELLTKFPTLLTDFDKLKNQVTLLEKKFKANEMNNKLIGYKASDNSSSEEITYLKLQIKDLLNKNSALEKDRDNIKKDIEQMQVKLKDLNIIDIIEATKFDQGNVDITKALVMTLEQKVFKKTQLIDEKIKHLEESMNKVETEQKNIKNFSEILKLSNEDNKRMMKNLEEIENKTAEEILSLNNEMNNINNEIKKLKNFETKTNEALKNHQIAIEMLESNLKNIDNKLQELEENLEENEPKKPGIDKQHFQKFKNEVYENLKDLKKKNVDLEKEIEYFKQHPDLIRALEEIKKIQKEINVKVNKTDFLDLKDKFSNFSIEIINLSDSVDKVQELAYKTKNEMGFFLKRLEVLSATQVSFRASLNDLIKKQQDILIDASKYLDLGNFEKFLLEFKKEKETNDNNFASMNKLLTEMAETIKSKTGVEDLKLFEQIIKNKLEELKLYSLRKLADKIETNRNIRYLDSQIRHIIDFYIKKSDKSESWLLAKKPLGGFSCASCESYIGDLKNNAKEFTPWSKYPSREDKNYRYGSGFSRMLNMLNIDFKNQLDAIKDNAYESDNEGRNSAEPKTSQHRRFSKNLSTIDVYNNNINSTLNKNKHTEILPKISLNKNNGRDINSNNNNTTKIVNSEYTSMDGIENGKSKEMNELYTLNNENDNGKYREFTTRKEDEPHAIKIYRKYKNKNNEDDKKE